MFVRLVPVRTVHLSIAMRMLFLNAAPVSPLRSWFGVQSNDQHDATAAAGLQLQCAKYLLGGSAVVGVV